VKERVSKWLNIIWLKLLLNSILLFVGHSRISIVWRSTLTEMTGLEAAEEKFCE
jgi:hypothetical protein